MPKIIILSRGTMFVADVMLKKLARWMRIFGIDVIYPDFEDDCKIMGLAREKGRILLTMDRELVQRAKKKGVRVFLVPKGSEEEQLKAVMKEFGIKIKFPEETLCPQCNGELKLAKRNEVADKVLESVLQRHEWFWVCMGCGKVYWKGSHWRRIMQMADKVCK
ncbi:MAG: Mut7-C RNAse domain-containing protein [Candidatus Micrarchaeia archaeon]